MRSVNGRRIAGGRADATLRSRRPTPFVGRDAELRCLLDAWRQAATGRGQVVQLSGPAGIGKSRMVGELRERAADQPHLAVWHRCAPEHAFSPFHPVVATLSDAGGLAEEPCGQGRPEPETSLAAGLGCCDEASLAALLGSDAYAGQSEPGLTPARLRSRTFEVLLARLEQLAEQTMLVAVYEDLQWADPSTLEFLDRMVDRIRRLPVLVLLTFRSGFVVPSRACAASEHLTLSRLEDCCCERMIDHLSGEADLGEPARQAVIARSGGVPLLVEELAEAMLRVVEEAEQDGLFEATPDVALPPTLPEALIARLDPFPEAGQLAQIGAVIGSEFAHDLLAAIADWPERRLDAALDYLVETGLVVHRNGVQGGTYAFRHALLRDAAYHSLPEGLRRNLHGRLAQILEASSADARASALALLAHHYAAAGLVEPAVASWLSAGENAADRCAHMEAVGLYSKGLELLDSLPAAPDSATPRAQLLAALGRALIALSGLAAPEVAQACALARTLCQSAGAEPRLFAAARNLWDFYNTLGEVEAARELAEQCQRFAAGAQDRGLLAEADFCLGVSSLFVGQLAEARERLMRSIVHRGSAQGRDLAPDDRNESRSIALGHLAQVLWLCGYPDQAARAGEEAVAIARAAGRPFALSYALLAVSWLNQFRRDADATRALAAEAVKHATDHGFPAFRAMAGIIRDWAAVERGTAKPAAAVTRMRAALDRYRNTGVEIARPYLLGLLAEVHGAAGEREQALAVLAEAADVARATGERWYEAMIRRQEGELLLGQSITNRRMASARFCQAIALAQQQGAKSLELRATLCLARVWADLGRHTEARDLLAPVYAWFKEGLATPDLKVARALLDDLA